MNKIKIIYQDFWNLIIQNEEWEEKIAVFDIETGKYLYHRKTENKNGSVTDLSYDYIPLKNNL